MTAVWYRFRTELQARWKSVLALALLAGIAGGVTLAAVAGARRTDSAFSRLLVGIPLGLVAGRWIWHGVADDLGIASLVSVPVLWLAAVVLLTLLFANLVAALPARTASRTHAATVLRSE